MSYYSHSPKKQEKILVDVDKKITIYGPYYPEVVVNRLKKLRNYLKENGFKNVYLVSNYPIPPVFLSHTQPNTDERNLARSRYCLNHSDLNVLIFTFEGPKDGVGFELLYSLENHKNYILLVEWKIEKNERENAISSLLKARMKEFLKSFIEFPEGDDKSLCDVVYQRTVDFFL